METIEIYFNKELSDITFDVEKLDEWSKICEDLGLDKQKELTVGKASPIPYPFMNLCMYRVYNTLCPEVVNFKKYKKTTIPLEVLQQIAFSVKEKHFSDIEIWYDDKSPDPLVVGKTGYWYAYSDSSYEHLKDEDGEDIRFNSREEAIETGKPLGYSKSIFNEEDKYLVAKWGAEKQPFNVLKQLATDRFIESKGASMKIEIDTITQKLKNLKEGAILYINGEISESKATTSNNW